MASVSRGPDFLSHRLHTSQIIFTGPGKSRTAEMWERCAHRLRVLRKQANIFRSVGHQTVLSGFIFAKSLKRPKKHFNSCTQVIHLLVKNGFAALCFGAGAGHVLAARVEGYLNKTERGNAC